MAGPRPLWISALQRRSRNKPSGPKVSRSGISSLGNELGGLDQAASQHRQVNTGLAAPL